MSNSENTNRKEKLQDLIVNILTWVVVTACAFLYWMAVLLLLSIFLMNIWNTSMEKILNYGIILTVITSIVYAGILIHRKFK